MTFYNGNYVDPRDVKSVVVNLDRAVSGNYIGLKFPSPGHVVGATIFANANESGTNTVQAGLINGGNFGAGTIVSAASAGGVLQSGSAYAMTIASGGPEAYNTGELCMINLTTFNTTTDIQVQIDYALAPTVAGN